MGPLLPHHLPQQHRRPGDDGNEHDAGDHDVPVESVGKNRVPVFQHHRRGRCQEEPAEGPGDDGQVPQHERRDQEPALPMGKGVNKNIKQQLHDKERQQ